MYLWALSQNLQALGKALGFSPAKAGYYRHFLWFGAQLGADLVPDERWHVLYTAVTVAHKLPSDSELPGNFSWDTWTEVREVYTLTESKKPSPRAAGHAIDAFLARIETCQEAEKQGKTIMARMQAMRRCEPTAVALGT